VAAIEETELHMTWIAPPVDDPGHARRRKTQYAAQWLSVPIFVFFSRR
jgi:hypothetical protein